MSGTDVRIRNGLLNCTDCYMRSRSEYGETVSPTHPSRVRFGYFLPPAGTPTPGKRIVRMEVKGTERPGSRCSLQDVPAGGANEPYPGVCQNTGR